MDAMSYAEKINFNTTLYVNYLVKAGHVPAIATGHLIQEITEVVDGYLQPQKQITNKQENSQ